MTRENSVDTVYDDTIVIGSGLAGIVCALALAPRKVTLLTKTGLIQGGSSYLAKGGIAAAIGPGDSPESHKDDTLSAGAGIGDAETILRFAAEGVADLQKLISEGVPFDRAADGTLELATEAAHRRARVVHAGGDATGQVLIDALIEKLKMSPSVTIVSDSFAYDLITDNGKVLGLLTFEPGFGWRRRLSPAIVLATGGIGMIWRSTTNPIESTGDGLAMAARAGAVLSDLEFMQFHPTALKTPATGSMPLLTEALRGAGALLVNELGERFMLAEHPAAELAPRDVVARAIEEQYNLDHSVYLDMRPVYAKGEAHLFPRAVLASRDAGIDPARELLPVMPAAHYHMGGVKTDEHGRTSIDGLWACGEVATTGVHGANRLASNSLLEALVYARRVATDIRERSGMLVVPANDPTIPGIVETHEVNDIVVRARDVMSRYVGIQRSGGGLSMAGDMLLSLAQELDRYSGHGTTVTFESVRRFGEARNQLIVARLVTLAALRRTESRGAHFRIDYPNTAPDWQRHQNITVEGLAA